MSSDNVLSVPKHVAFILDGNRRWAKLHGLEVFKGHERVAKNILLRLVDHAVKKQISYVTFWAFSTENWNRSKTEVSAILSLFREAFQTNIEELDKRNIRIQVIGNIEVFPLDIAKQIRQWQERTRSNTGLTVIFGLNYGGRDEILRAVKRILTDLASHPTWPVTFRKEEFEKYLDTANLPDPDLIIRTGGEQRLSGFLPWQSEYAELYFTPTLMPDFDEAALDEALAEYARRNRRFGK